MKVRTFKKAIRIVIGKFDVHAEVNPYEISVGLTYGYQYNDSMWLGIKLPFLMIELAVDLREEWLRIMENNDLCDCDMECCN